MAHLHITGGRSLEGELVAAGAKNAALPIMAAALLAKGDVCLSRVPNITDVGVMSEILRSIGARVEFNGSGKMVINGDNITTVRAPYELVGMMNASFDIAGPLLARYQEAEVPLPGGCNLGSRPVNLHLDGFRSLGAEVSSDHGYIRVKAHSLRGNRIFFPKTSVGATKNCMMAATLAEGRTILENAAREPEVVDLASFLNRMGARISGMGSPNIEIEGVSELHGIDYEIIPDRILTGTYLIAGALTGGDVTIRKTNPDFIEALTAKLTMANQEVATGRDWVRVKGRRPAFALEVSSSPHPGFPTDLQPIMAAMLTLARGTSIIVETIFDRRYMYVDEMRRLGADMWVSDRTCVIRGVEKLSGAPVKAPDIRAGGALVVAALISEGESQVSGLEFIDRGYERIEEALVSLGADIRRIG
ncbi:MAG: UDP-N-acetylglucosamine 1-carboxyvinyltransferase [Candidatus Eremiobacteraeota bacterium]|nr:UDP-N-acetylglucosamine 1-carboxyvinyltransferase [Candidatus Eremiobacteraeota bacterium]